MVLTYVSLMTNDIEDFFLCLSAICIYSVVKCLFKSFTHFLILFSIIENAISFTEWSKTGN